VLRYVDCCVLLLVVSLADGKRIAQVGELAKEKLTDSQENVEKLCAVERQVSASRGREDIAILTSDVNRLGESLGVSMARPSTIELANEIAHSKQQSVDLAPKASIEVPPPQLEISLGHGFELSM
jgi:hypothetical protein